jgi:methylthioribulose-1-phosphate dehydratase
MTSDKSPNPLDGCERLIRRLRSIGRSFHRRGWSVGTSSNYSAVIQPKPLELIVTASGKDKGRLRSGDFVRVDSHGRPTAGHQPKSSAETMLHVVLARRANVGAILHTHSVWSTLLSQRHFEDRGLEIHGYEMLKGLEGVATHEHREWVPIFDNTQDIPSLAAEVEAYLQQNFDRCHGYLIRQHGLYTWGRDLDEATRHVEIFEFLFECLVRQGTLG